MKILLYNPDNGVTRNFMPHLWMFLLKALTPPEHEVLLIDGNAQALDEEGLASLPLYSDWTTTRQAYRVGRSIKFASGPQACPFSDN